jgi:predicted lipoprotein with Yx(FWY)xxD motif
MRPLHAVVVGALGLAFVAAGCGGAVPSSDGGPATVKLASSHDGRYLVDGQGHSVYLFEKDEAGESYCNGACAAVWPPLETSSRPQARTSRSSARAGTS